MKKNLIVTAILTPLLCMALLTACGTADTAKESGEASPPASSENGSGVQTGPTLEELLGEDYVNYITETIIMQMGNRMNKTPEVHYFPIVEDASLSDYVTIDETTVFEIADDGNVVILFPAGTVADAAHGEQSFRIPRTMTEKDDKQDADSGAAESEAPPVTVEQPEDKEEPPAEEVPPAPPAEKPVEKPSVEIPSEKPAETPDEKPSEDIPVEDPVETPPDDSQDAPASKIDIAAFYEKLAASENWPAMSAFDDNAVLDSIYPGLSEIKTNQRSVYMTMMSVAVGELVLVEVTDSADVQKVMDILQARVDYQVGDDTNPGGAWYPASIEGWKNGSRIVSNGNYVMMIVKTEGADDVVTAFNALFS